MVQDGRWAFSLMHLCRVLQTHPLGKIGVTYPGLAAGFPPVSHRGDGRPFLSAAYSSGLAAQRLTLLNGANL